MSQGSRFAVVMAALAASLSVAVASNAFAAGSSGMTRIVSPTSNQVVGKTGVHVVLKSRASLAKLQVLINGHNVKRYFHQAGDRYQADLRPGRGLQPGIDNLIVVTGRSTDFDSVTFIVARQDPKLLKLTNFRAGGPQTPVLASAKVARGSTLRAWVNGHRDDTAFQPQGSLYVGRLGANDFLRAGSNRIRLLAYRTSRSQRSASYAVLTKTFTQKRGQLIAGAGKDVTVNAGDFVRLDGTATALGNKGAGQVTYSWNVTARPQGVAPRLTAPATNAPGFQPKVAGIYRIAVKTVAANGSTSVDTVTVTAREDVPPIGAPLETVADDQGTIKLNGEAVKGTTAPCDAPCASKASYALFERGTLQLVKDGSGYVTKDANGVAELIDKATTNPGALMVINMYGPWPATVRKLLDTLGVTRSSVSDTDLTQFNGPYSIVGVSKGLAGSGFIARGFINSPRTAANMSGYLRLNPALPPTGAFEFVFADQVEFDTDAGSVTSQISMKVGDTTFTHAVPADGSSGFYMVRLNSQTLALEQSSVYVTDKPGGSEDPAESKRLADDLTAAVNAGPPGRQLVLLQAFGKPKGTSAGWLAAAAAIGNLGGTAQVFAQLNQKTTDEPKEGRYAFVGRSAMDTGAAESSQALTGQPGDGKLHGLLGRNRNDRYEPLAADPSGTINFQLVDIVNRRPAAGGGFESLPDAQAAAAAFLGRTTDPTVMGVCDPDPAVHCDVRKEYYEDMSADWNTILTRLDGSAGARACANGGPGFAKDDCDKVRVKLSDEIAARNAVVSYFIGPHGLRAPFGTAQVGALVDVNKIASDIAGTIKPPATNNATADAFEVISHVVELAGLAVGSVSEVEAVHNVAKGLSAAFGLASYLTRDDGTPDLVGPEITAKAADLGSILFKHYQAASDYLTTEAQIVISDGTKLNEVARDIPKTSWRLPDDRIPTGQLDLATKQTIYQALFPVAYPELYNLGTSQVGYSFGDARSWKCKGPGVLVDKNLFQHTDPGAQMIWPVPPRSGFGHSAVIAVGARLAVGHTKGAYVPAPPDTLTGPLFTPSDQPGGIGLYKLQFYSPQNFQLFQPVLQQHYENGLAGSGFGYYWCTSMPDPPGNGA